MNDSSIPNNDNIELIGYLFRLILDSDLKFSPSEYGQAVTTDNFFVALPTTSFNIQITVDYDDYLKMTGNSFTICRGSKKHTYQNIEENLFKSLNEQIDSKFSDISDVESEYNNASSLE